MQMINVFNVLTYQVVMVQGLQPKGDLRSKCVLVVFYLYLISFKLNANFPGLLSALQPFSNPLKPLPLIIGLPSKYTVKSPQGNYFSPLFKQHTSI